METGKGSERANTKKGGLRRSTAVCLNPEGVSPVRAVDISANVDKWCLNGYENPKDTELGADTRRVVLGGFWERHQAFPRPAHRYDFAPIARVDDLGFRLRCTSPIL